jgi:hypothetical protein
MANCYCVVTTPEQSVFDGTHKLSSSGSGSTTRNCYVARLDSDSELQLCASGSRPYGLFYDNLDLEWQPEISSSGTDCIDINSYAADEYVNVATAGAFKALVGPDAFTEGSIPAINAALYEGASGKITVTPGTYRIGRCINQVTVQHRAGSYSVADCIFDFDF